MESKSNCPVNKSLEVFGDKWSLLIIRDLMFNEKRTYREFLYSDEKIATNILATRLEMLCKEGIIIKKKDPNHKQKIIYSLTEKGIDILPIIIEIGCWGVKYKPVTSKQKLRAKELKNDKEKLLKEMKRELLKNTQI
ncbi:MAG: helix-turn-helix transcriptional regulator [Flavobacteriaceae bacterium]|nr:helix-turn-helix transcriptional regulator [Flavobacteriaceae bacterium]